MADAKISQLPVATSSAGTDVLPIVQSNTTKQLAIQNLVPQNLKSNATTGILQVTGPAAGTTRVMTAPNANFTAARTDAAQSFTGDQTIVTGNIVQGTAGKGFNFNANTPAIAGAAQLLYAYEDGAFTATLTSVTPPTNPITATAQYIRVGGYVCVFIIFRGVDNTGAAGAVSITGLPIATGPNVYSAGALWGGRLASGQLNAYIGPSSTTISIVDAAGNQVSWASTGGGVYLGCQLTYKV